ncbi:sensor histidine kinase [Amycolatopsis sp. CA-230715]|uniref:sensor histidine kinase n=1 Tax=Amycolatopsis sp. CA-230715 TaxID=2745196 RepID=UPI0020B34D17|nr:histidine kinase [Amycolatopsis sp. CA-230715]
MLVVFAVAAIPVLWAAVVSGPGRFSVAETAFALAVLLVLAFAVPRLPATALAIGIAGWVGTYTAHASADATIAMGAPALGLAAASFLAGRGAATGRDGVVVLVLGTAAAIAVPLAVLGGLDSALSSGAGVAVLAAVPWAAGRYRRRYEQLTRGGWERAEQLEREAERTQARERARLAGEMHDLVGHELALAALRIGALEVDTGLSPEHRDAAKGARAAVTSAAERVADVVRILRTVQDLPVEPVAAVVDGARASGLSVDLVEEGEPPRHPIIARTIHRVVVEALTNAAKHAPGSEVSVRVVHGDDGTDLRISDTGAAGGEVPVGGHGLVGLAERVGLVGGRFDAGRTADGFAVVAFVPAEPAAPATTGAHRTRMRQEVRRSARRAIAVAVGVAVGVVAAVCGYLVFDAASSMLDPADFAGLTIGQDEASVSRVLPGRTRVEPADPACRYYSTHANPFDERHGDLFRLCFRDGVLTGKDLLVHRSR